MVTLFLVVLFGGVWSAGGQENLKKLSNGYKAGVELAVEQVNTHPGVQQHFLFFKSLKQSEVDVSLYASFLYLFLTDLKMVSICCVKAGVCNLI